MSEKLTGYSLLVVGLLIIAASLFSVFQVATKRALPVQVFTFPAISLDASSVLPSVLPKQTNQAQTPKMELIPADVLNSSANLFAHVFIMGFVTTVGYKVASLGIQLLRPIKVQVKQ